MGLLVVLILAAFVTSSYASSASQPWLDPQLPRSLWPVQCSLWFTPHIEEMYFEGFEHITLEVLNQTKFIIVHAKNLNISLTLVRRNGTDLSVTRAFAYEKHSYWVVETEELLLTGHVIVLSLNFYGKLGILTGITKTNIKNENTQIDSPMVITMFKPNYSRLAFPNFDEPFFKSLFGIEIFHWANYTAVSNAPIIRIKNGSREWKITRFEWTQPISSYAVSFVISQFVSRNSTLPDGKPQRVWARPDRVHRVDYALKVTYDIQAFFDRELGNITTLEKLDQFAVPSWFQRGGNARWGQIIQDEAPLTYNSTLIGDKYRQRIVTLVATELAHSYFGQLITCRDWNHVWVDSGLSRFYALKATAAIESVSHEEQDLKEHGFRYDSSNDSRPLVESTADGNYDVEHPLIYNKGAALLKMMEGFLGSWTFKRGINRYIHGNMRNATVTQDLFDALQMVVDPSTNITKIMEPWVYSMGFPLITIGRGSNKTITARQQRFLMDRSADPNYPPSTHGYKWLVPLSYRTRRGKIGRVWLNDTESVFRNLLNDDESWIIFNYDQSGYYRVNYEPALWGNITKQLEKDHTFFTDLERSQLLSDILNVAKAEILKFDSVLNLTLYAWKERCLSPWTHIYSALEIIRRKMLYINDIASYKKYVLNLTTNVMNELEVVDKGTFEHKVLRQKIIQLSCYAGHRGCLENTTRLFKAWIQNDTLNAIPVNFRRLVYCRGIANSTNFSEWNTTVSRFLAKKILSRERESLLLAMACTKNLGLIQRYIDMFLSNNTKGKILFTDLEKALEKSLENAEVTGFIWNWLKTNRPKIDNRFHPGASAELAYEVTRVFHTNEKLQEVRNFFAGMNLNSSRVEEAKKRTVKRINANIRWMNIQFGTVRRWLQQNFPE